MRIVNHLLFVASLAVGVIIAGGITDVVSAQMRRSYVSQCFRTFDDMMRGANAATDASRNDYLQFVTIPSERNYGGILGSPYCIIYKK